MQFSSSPFPYRRSNLLLSTAKSACIAALVAGSSFAETSSATTATPSISGAVNLDQPTFVDDIAAIFHDNCLSCHRTGEIAPMSLLTYNEVRPWAKSIMRAVKNREMPPWDADPGYGPFSNDISLSDKDIHTIVRWVASGAPRGEGEEPAPKKTTQEGEWALGEPDWIHTFETVEVAGDGPDQFKVVRIPETFPEDRWIKSVEVLPGSPDVLHHFILWRADEANQNQEAWMGGWAAGAKAIEFPEGTARLLPAGRAILGDFHYHPSGDPAADKTRLGIRFAKPEDVEKELTNLWILNASFNIPAGDANYGARASYVFPQDVEILSLAPHMHYRGKDMTYTATFPDGEQRELLKVSRYDFNWQTGYDFEEPVAIPAGTKLLVEAHFDNSTDNLFNPDPTKDVAWGTDSTDEMLIGFVDYVVKDGVSPKPVSLVLGKLAELSEEFPGEVWRIDAQRTAGQPPEPMAVHLPKNGNPGGWYVQFGSMVLPAPIRDVVWDGDRVTAKAMIPGQDPMPIVGTLDSSTGYLTLTFGPGSLVGTPAELEAQRLALPKG